MSTTTTTRNHRARWAAIGAAIAVSLGAGGIGLVNATSPEDAATLVPIDPCRIADTRPTQLIGLKTTAFGHRETHVVHTQGANTGECDPLPAGATGVALNVTAVGPSTLTHITIWASGSVPNSSSLNPAPGQPPTPNAVTTEVADDGTFRVFNFAGRVHLIIDVVGYYTDHHHDDRYYSQEQVDEMFGSVGKGVEWINVNASGTIRSTSPGFAGATVQRPPLEPDGHYCIHVPGGHGLTSEAAVGSVQNGGGGGQPRTVEVTTTFGNACNATGNWFVAVETYSVAAKSNLPFMVIVPRN